jgi:O-succinylbenzoic acid--CoA ligase
MPWISIDGIKYPSDQLPYTKEYSEHVKNALNFVQEWTSETKQFVLKTSGSTGEPKEILVTRQQMIDSAKQTIKALQLKPNQTSLLCINSNFIGGKMMIVRSLLNQMNLIIEEPTSNPLIKINEVIDFMAIVPLQLNKIITEQSTKKKLNTIKSVIVGGGKVDYTLEDQLQNVTCPVYATYGMTETVSHIALQKLNGQKKSPYFTTLDKVIIDKDDRGCLTINAPVTNHKTIVTNDLVDLIDKNTFRWLGRIDNVINSGGIKIQSEQLERKIEEEFFKMKMTNRFFIYGVDDQLLGNKIILFIEGKDKNKPILDNLKKVLTKFEMPKNIYFIEFFNETDTGKIQRDATVNSFKKA